MRCIQLNANRSATVQDLVWQTSLAQGIDFAFVAEPHARSTASEKWLVDGDGDAAIGVVSGRYAMGNVLVGSGWVAVDLTDWLLISAYISPNSGMDRFHDVLGELERLIRNSRKPVLVAGDFNAECAELGGTRSTARGYAMAALLASLDLAVLNEPAVRTFVGRGGGSVVDITLVTADAADRVESWAVSEEEFGSDHRAIIFVVTDDRPRHQPPFRRWKLTDGQLLRAVDDAMMGEGVTNPLTPEVVTSALTRECEKASRLPRRATASSYWWSADIASLRMEATRKRRNLTRARRRATASAEELDHLNPISTTQKKFIKL